MSTAAAIDRPYERLAPLPRELWLPGLTGAFGDTAARLAHAERWLAALERGELPTSISTSATRRPQARCAARSARWSCRPSPAACRPPRSRCCAPRSGISTG